MTNDKIYSSAEINELFRQVAKGDYSAFTVLYDCTYEDIYRNLRNYFHNPDFIEEAIDDAFDIFAKKADTLGEHENGIGWLYTTAKFCLLNIYKQNKKIVFTDKLDDLVSVSYDLDKLHTLIDLKVLMNNLKPQAREMIYQIYYLKKSKKETMKLLNISKSTLQRQESKILAYLKENLNYEN